MEQKPEEDPAVQNEEEKDPASAEDASADVEQEEEQDEAKEEGPQSQVEQAVSEAVDKYGEQPPIDAMVELAAIFDAIPGSAEYDEFMAAVQKFCGNGYGEQLDTEMQQVAGSDKDQEEEAKGDDGGEPPPEAEAAEEQDEEAEGDEEKAEDPATAEEEGPAAEEIPEELAEEPAVQEELEAKSEEEEEEAPAGDEVKDENAEAVEAEGEEEQSEDEEEEQAPGSDLRRGDSSPDVEELQNLLVSLGFMTQEEMDTGPGIFGPRTEAALKAYQESMGLPATGFYGPQTRETLVQASEPASPMEQVVLDLVASNGPQPDFGIMVGAYLTIEAALQAEFMIAVANQCGDDYATQLQAELDNAASSPEANAENDEEQQAEEPAAEEKPEEEESEEVAAAPEEQVETEAPAEEIAEAKEEVAEVAPEVVPEEQKEEVEGQEAEGEEEAEGEKAQEEEQSPAEEATEEAKEDEEEQGEDEVAAAPDAEPEEKEQAADEQQEELAQNPEEATVDEEEASEESEDELEANKEEIEDELEEEVAEQPDNTQTIEALQALIEEADRLLAAQLGILQDPVLDTTQQTIQADAEKMMAQWDGDLDNYIAQLQELADKLTSTDVGQATGMEDVVAAAAAKAAELQDAASSLQGAAPGNVTVNAQLDDGTTLAFDAPISSRDTAVEEILQAFLMQLEMRESEEGAEESKEGEGAEAPPEA